VTIAERDAPAADAVVSGSDSAWITAFSPERDRSGLEQTGDAVLAGTLLDALAGATVGAPTSTRAAA
jgi:hypothetical protein